MEVPPTNVPSDDTRFRVELQFINLLSDPRYISSLVGAGYFNDPSFINYLKYLKYWSTPEYIKYVKYPISLYFLDLLTSDDNYYKRFQDKRFFDQVIWDLKNFTMKSVNYYSIRAKEDYENNLKQEQQEQQQFQMQQPQPQQ